MGRPKVVHTAFMRLRARKADKRFQQVGAALYYAVLESDNLRRRRALNRYAGRMFASWRLTNAQLSDNAAAWMLDKGNTIRLYGRVRSKHVSLWR